MICYLNELFKVVLCTTFIVLFILVANAFSGMTSMWKEGIVLTSLDITLHGKCLAVWPAETFCLT